MLDRSGSMQDGKLDAALTALEAMDRRSLNYDVARPKGFTAEDGWRIDDYRQPLRPSSRAPGRRRPLGGRATVPARLTSSSTRRWSAASSAPTSRSSGVTAARRPLADS